MGGVLLVRSKSRPDLFFLALAVIALTITLLRLSLFESSIAMTGALFAIPLATDLLIFPLFWCFTLSVIGRDSNLSSSALPWFVPWFLFAFYSLAFYLLALFEPSLTAKKSLALSWHYQKVRQFEDYLTGPFNVLLGGIIVWRLLAYIRLINNWVPDHLHSRLRTYRLFLLLASSALVAVFTQFLSLYFFENHDANLISKTAQVFYVVTIYALGFLGYQFTALPRFQVDADRSSITKLDFSDEEKQKLSALFTNDIHLNPELNLGQVAAKLGMSANRASNLIRAVSGNNFRTYVNEFRVKDVKTKLADSSNDGYSILSIAMESGFKSEASFYRVFKDSTGLSPSEYRKTREWLS